MYYCTCMHVVECKVLKIYLYLLLNCALTKKCLSVQRILKYLLKMHTSMNNKRSLEMLQSVKLHAGPNFFPTLKI